MKLLVGLVFAILASVAVSDRFIVPLNPMEWYTESYSSGQIINVATKKDLLVYLDVSGVNIPPNPSGKRGIGIPVQGSPVMAVRRRNSDGVYVPVGNFTEFTSPEPVTNGKWVAVYSEITAMFSVDENNVFSNASYLPTLNGVFVLSDDTVVGYKSVSGNSTFSTFQYEASNNTWQEIEEAALIFNGVVSWQSGINSASYQASDTHLVFVDMTNSSNFLVYIYERQADKSWKFTESVPINSSGEVTYVNYNNVDTLAVFVSSTEGENMGILFIYTKSNGKWTEQKFTATSVGFRPVGYLGISTVFTDSNSLLVSAPLEGFTANGGPPTVSGRVLFMTRNDNGLWEPTADMVGPGQWGFGMGVNDYDIVIPSIVLSTEFSPTLTFYTAPLCFNEPINVTCSQQQVNDCSQVNVSALYTVNNPQCGAVAATINSLGLVNNKAVQAQFSFSKGYGATASCNATVTCPVPPVVVQQTPSKVSSVAAVQLGLVSLFGCLACLFV